MNEPKRLSEMWGYAAAAEYLNISVAHLRKLTMVGRVPFYRPFGIGGRVLFDPDELRDFVLASRVSPRKQLSGVG